MNLLAAFRRQLVVEGKRGEGPFTTILRWLRRLWLVSVAASVVILGWGVWVLLPPHGPSDGWAIIAAPMFAALTAIGGYVPYGLGRLFLTPLPDAATEDDQDSSAANHAA